MKTYSQTELAEQLGALLEEAAKLDNPLLIERGGDQHDVVIVSDRDFRGMLTTIEILSDPILSAKLTESIAELNRVPPEAAAAE